MESFSRITLDEQQKSQDEKSAAARVLRAIVCDIHVYNYHRTAVDFARAYIVFVH